MDTIFAPLTVKGKCSIYVIRISGTKVNECLKVLGIKKKLSHKEVCISKLSYNGDFLDEVVLVYFKAPNSFTGEDVVEISLHCSKYIISKVFSILSSINGVRLAEHGEFSKRAFLNNKMDLIQAESILNLINSNTELQHKFALNQLFGNNSNYYNSLRKNIVEILSIIESYVDFPEEDISIDILDEIKTKIKSISIEINSKLNDNKVGEIVNDGFRIAIIGEPNSGKSTLMNILSKRDVAIVSNIAGTTRDVIQVNLDLDGIPVILYDTAGIRKTSDILENEGIKRAISTAKNTNMKLLIISVENFNLDEQLLNLIDENTIILINKVDLNIDFVLPKYLENKNIFYISLKEDKNINELISFIKNKLDLIISPNIDTVITNQRCRTELQNTLNFLNLFDEKKPIEINAENIRSAAESVGRITGKITTDEILDNIFSKFCIGK